jgi:hypothetical protein
MAATPKPLRKTDKSVKTLQRRSRAAKTAYKKADDTLTKNYSARIAGTPVSKKPLRKLQVASRKAGDLAAKTRKKTIKKAVASNTLSRVPSEIYMYGGGFRLGRGVKTGTRNPQPKPRPKPQAKKEN